jgi:hypothetical protein
MSATLRALAIMAAVWSTGCARADSSSAPAEPVALREVQPPEGPSAGGPFATVVGTGFDTHAPVEVMFGDVPAPRAVVIAADRVQVEIPGGVPGSEVTIRVSQPGHGAASLERGFRYRAED